MIHLPGDGADADPSDYGERIADVYDEWHGTRDPDLAPVVEFLASRAGDQGALELGIGTGRIALPLARHGVPVAGIDASARMVERLRSKPGGPDVPVTRGDFADVRAPGGRYGLVYVVFNTFFALLTQDEQLRCFSNVAANLVPGGAFVMEAFVPDLTRYDRGQRLQVDHLEAQVSRVSASIHDLASQRVRTQMMVIGAQGIDRYPVELRYAWPGELDLMARLAGMRLAGRWGGWQGEPFTSASSRHVSVWETQPG
jgi:SAM-dependent methyltransferase